MHHDARCRSIGMVVILLLAVPILAIDCRTRTLTPSEQLDELTNQHRVFAQMGEIITIEVGLEGNLRALTARRHYKHIEMMRTSVELSRAALAYAKTVCLPITKTEQKTLASMFVGVIGANENTDSVVVDQFVNRPQSTDKEKLAKKVATIAARQSAGAALGKAVGELTGNKIGEIVGKVVRGGPIGTAVGILLGASEIGPGDAFTGPGTAPGRSVPMSHGSDHDHGGSIHEGNINDAPAERIAEAGRTAYVALPESDREKNNRRIRDAREAIKTAKH